MVISNTAARNQHVSSVVVTALVNSELSEHFFMPYVHGQVLHLHDLKTSALVEINSSVFCVIMRLKVL